MKKSKMLGVGALVALVTACGGGGSGNSGTAAYPYVTPSVGNTSTYAITDVDDSGNTINLSEVKTVTQVNPDGTFSVAVSNPSNNSVTVNGTTYGVTPETYTYDNTGHELTGTTTSGTTTVTCTQSPHGAGASYPLFVGETWQIAWTQTCTNSNYVMPFSQSGQVVDIESITIPAGTFPAIKTTATETWTNSLGTVTTMTSTVWKYAAAGHPQTQLKDISTRVLSGVMPTNGYLKSETIVLQSAP